MQKHYLNVYLSSCCWMKIGWNGITDCLSAVHLVTQLLLDCIELVANCWSLSNFYIRLKIKKREKLPIFFSMTLPYFCCLGSEVKDYLVWNGKISNFQLYFEMIYKKIISLETLQIFVPCLCFIFIYRKIISYKIMQFFPLFLSNHSLRMPVTNWLTDSLTYGLVEDWMK